MNSNIIDYLFLYSFFSIWLLLMFNIVLALGGYKYYNKRVFNKRDTEPKLKEYPFVSILIPAHNEEKVITRTVKSMFNLYYPKDKYEVIVINDNSSDNTRAILKELKYSNSSFNLKVINTTKENGGKGKSNALNIGISEAKGEYIAVYDADNTPEPFALIYLVNEIINNSKYGAVIGKFRTRNKHKNTLTKFINIETLSFQWMIQAGRFELFGICTIPGTNFLISRKALDEVGGWDPKAIAEDTEISFKLFEKNYRIGLVPHAITWEQEPESLKVWLKQRTRWVKGNIYVVIKYLPRVFSKQFKNIGIDVFYYISIYFLFMSSLVISNTIFIMGLFTDIKITLSGNYILLWILAYLIFVIQIIITLSMEKGESTLDNFAHVIIIYFTYSQLWLVVALKGLFLYLTDIVFSKNKTVWYKTERFD